MIRVEIVNGLEDCDVLDAYKTFYLNNPRSLVYGSLRYLRFIKDVTGSDPFIFICWDRDRIVGTLPVFVKCSAIGPVMNSLPWYGSNPGIITLPDESPEPVYEALLERFSVFCRDQGAVSSTVVTRPFEIASPYERHFGARAYQDYRVGMVNDLPVPGPKASGLIMGNAHQKTRNQIRKGMKGGFDLDSGEDCLHDVACLHAKNMIAIGAVPKSREAFEALQRCFEYGVDYDVIVARDRGKVVAGLVTLYYNRTAEYFVPGLDAEYRDKCPLHLVIFEAMMNAARRGMKWWNWGGTRPVQQFGVYHFKRRWGAKEVIYYYFNRVYREDLLSTFSKARILDEFKYFYVMPFDVETAMGTRARE